MKFQIFKKKQKNESSADEISSLRQSLRKSPDNIRLYIRIAEACMAKGMQNEAVEEYKKAAEVYESKNFLPIAEALYKQIIHIDSERHEIFDNIAAIQLKQGFIGDSVATLEALASKLYEKGMKEKAIEVICRIKSIDPDNKFFSQKAAKLFEKFQNMVPSDSDKWKLMDENKQAVQFSQPEEYFDLEAALQSDNSIDLKDEQVCLENDSIISHDDIFRELKKSVTDTEENQSSYFHFNLGLAQERCGNFQEALEEYKLAEAVYEDKSRCYLRIAVCYGGLKNKRKAEKYIKKAFKAGDLTDEEKLNLKYELASIYRKNGAHKKALKLFKEVIKTKKYFRDVERQVKELMEK